MTPLTSPPIFLIGLPGSGKSTLGKALARSLEHQFIDLDKYIESRFCCSVADFFARHGEERFRTVERNLLHEAGEMTGVVVACGGGTPCFFDSMDYMLSRGTVIYLQASRERLHERLCLRRAKRPAVRDLSDEQVYAYIDSLLASRHPVYSRAHLCLESSRLEDRAQIDSTLASLLPMLISNHLINL